MTFRTTFRDTRSSRQIALIDLPCPKNARRIFAIVSTISIPTSAPIIMEASVDPQPPGSRLDADHPENGVLIPRRNTEFVFEDPLIIIERFICLRGEHRLEAFRQCGRPAHSYASLSSTLRNVIE